MTWRLGLPLLVIIAAAGCVAVSAFSDDGVSMAMEKPLAPFQTFPPAPARGSQEAASCAAPKPMASLRVTSRYKPGDPSSSIVDPRRQARSLADMDGLNRFLRPVVLDANRYQSSQGANRAAARCALGALQDWAKADALANSTADMTTQLKLATTQSGLSLAYLQLKPAASVEQKQVIEAWLNRRSADIRSYFDARRGKGSPGSNVIYWAGLAVTSASTATGSKQDLDWGMTIYQDAVCTVDADGALPSEMRRGDASLHYQAYALNPLFALAEFGRANGFSAYEACDGALLRAADFTFEALDDPALASSKAHSIQKGLTGANGLPSRSLFAWAAIYRQVKPLPASIAGLNQGRLASAELGGDQGLLYRTQVH